jgi:chaperonin GroES
MDKFEPFGDRVLLEFHEEERKTKGGLFVPETSRNRKMARGRVLRTGPDCAKVKKGAIVYFGQYAGVEVDLGEDKPFLVIFEKDILGCRA